MGGGEVVPRGCEDDCDHQAWSVSTCEGTWKCWPCTLCSPSTDGAGGREVGGEKCSIEASPCLGGLTHWRWL